MTPLLGTEERLGFRNSGFGFRGDWDVPRLEKKEVRVWRETAASSQPDGGGRLWRRRNNEGAMPPSAGRRTGARGRRQGRSAVTAPSAVGWRRGRAGGADLATT